MRSGVFLIGRPSDARLSRLLAEVSDAAFTYDQVGATARPDDLPAGYHHVRASRVVGHGDDAFAAAVAGVRGWRLHRGQGFRVAPAEPAIEIGTVVVVAAPLVRPLPVHVTAACRIAWVVDQPGRFGFGYGTLPVHPASGEEAFVVERDSATGEVRLAIVAFSRAQHPLVRLAGPMARWQQSRATQGYLHALGAHVRAVTT